MEPPANEDQSPRSLERAFFQNLHEIQRLQAAPSRATVQLPIALEVDANVHQGGQFEASFRITLDPSNGTHAFRTNATPFEMFTHI